MNLTGCVNRKGRKSIFSFHFWVTTSKVYLDLTSGKSIVKTQSCMKCKEMRRKEINEIWKAA